MYLIKHSSQGNSSNQQPTGRGTYVDTCTLNCVLLFKFLLFKDRDSFWKKLFAIQATCNLALPPLHIIKTSLMTILFYS